MRNFIYQKKFEKENITITTASTQKNAISTKDQKKECQLISSIKTPDNYDAIILIGGPGTQKLFNNNILHKLINKFNNQNKLIGAICISPVILAKTGILKQRKATVYIDGKLELINNDAIFTDKDVVVDKNIITANGPKAAKKFAQTIIKKLK
jgi:protease I